MKIKLILSPADRTIIVAALLAYDNATIELANRISSAPEFDPADDGPEVELLSAVREAREQIS